MDLIIGRVPILLILVATLQISRCSTIDEKPCEDVTLGDCQEGQHWEENILKIIDGISVTECQGACLEYADCVTYRFSYPSDSEQSHCWLLVYDYRQECRSSAAPKGNPDVISDCLASAGIECDRHIEEDCEYIGNVVDISTPGSIVSPVYCEQFCEIAYLGCNYWYFKKISTGNICTAFDTDDRICKAIGGPQKPSLEECLGTTISTTTNKAPTTTSNEKCPYTKFKGQNKNLVPLGPQDDCCQDSSCLNDNNFCNDWQFQEEGEIVSQLKNNEPATILLDELAVQGVDFNGTMKVTKNFDSDWVGVIFGYQDSSNFFIVLAPGSNSPNRKDHWRVTKVASKTGDTNSEMTNAITNSQESVPDQTEVLWIDSVDDNGWKFDVEYFWQLQYRPIQGYVSLQVYEDTKQQLLFDLNKISLGPINNDRKFGVFVRSQPSVSWYDMTYECNDDE